MRASSFSQLQQRLRDPLLTALTAMLAIFLFVIAPFQATGVAAAHGFGIVFGLVLIAAVFIVSRSVLAVGAIMVAIALVMSTTVMRLYHPSVLDIYLDAGAWLLTSVTLTVVVGRAVFAAGPINYHRVIGAVLLYLNIGLIFVALFCFVALLAPKSFSGFGVLKDDLSVASSFIYFSFVTLTTVGYGDIVPLHPIARGLCNVEAIIGQLYPATLLARLVTLEIENRRVKGPNMMQEVRDKRQDEC
jgi:Ion channel